MSRTLGQTWSSYLAFRRTFLLSASPFALWTYASNWPLSDLAIWCWVCLRPGTVPIDMCAWWANLRFNAVRAAWTLEAHL